MRIYLVRHGRAFSREENDERPLNPSGKEEVIKVAEYLAKLNSVRPSVIYHSSKLRAKQTAKIFGDKLGGELKQIDELLPLAQSDRILNYIGDEDRDLMFVGHLPNLQLVTGFLTAHNTTAKIVDIKPSTVICIEREQKKYFIDWMITPSII